MNTEELLVAFIVAIAAGSIAWRVIGFFKRSKKPKSNTECKHDCDCH